MKKLLYILLLLVVLMPSCSKINEPEKTSVDIEDPHVVKEYDGDYCNVTITGRFQYPGPITDLRIIIENTTDLYCDVTYEDYQITATMNHLNRNTLYYYYMTFNNGFGQERSENYKFWTE